MKPELSKVDGSPTATPPLVEPGKPLFIEAVCDNCGVTVFRYRWETSDRDWLHVTTKRNACQVTTRAKVAS